MTELDDLMAVAEQRLAEYRGALHVSMNHPGFGDQRVAEAAARYQAAAEQLRKVTDQQATRTERTET
jgi:hypothetical protein